jgi:DNA mismatch repair ATPase MutS
MSDRTQEEQTMPVRVVEPLAFHSILFDDSEAAADIDGQAAPEFFTDLNLDQIVASITAGRDEYNLKPFFYARLSNTTAIDYRYDIFRDLGNRALLENIQSFAGKMRAMREHLAQAEKLRYRYQKESWFLDAADLYCDAVNGLARALVRVDVRSLGFLALRAYLTDYVESRDFSSLTAETQQLTADLSGIRYSLQIAGKRIRVDRYNAEMDYGVDVLRTFDKFKQGEAKDYGFDFHSWPDMNHVEAAILDRVAQLYPEIFLSLDGYYTRHSGYLNATIATFDREVQFYIACLDHVDRFKRTGLTFCYPIVSDRSKEVCGRDVFDLALADKLLRERTPVVTNDFFLKEPERIFVVSGPNQGGKTTFARIFGQVHYLAGIGCPVPGSEARLFLFDNLFTHFEREEDIRNLSSKLENDLLRIHGILERATSRSILIMNESFLSTTLDDALYLSKEIMGKIIERDMLCLSVTFLDELASLGQTTVSMVSTVDPADPARRTFKVIRKLADGLAYAVAIAEKYRLTYESVKGRISR